MPERHDIEVADGESVDAVHHPAGGDDWLVACHGFTSDKTGAYEDLCERAVEEGYDAVRFDFRGCGESDGAFVEQTLSDKVADLRAVVDRFDPESYVLYGSSFGCKVSLHAIPDEDRVEALVGRAPVTFARPFDGAREVVVAEGAFRYDAEKSIDERFFDDFDRYDFAAVSHDIGVPVALFHGRDDAVVDVRDSLDAAAALETDVAVEVFAGEGHLFSEAALDRLFDRAFDWLADADRGNW